MGAVSYSEHPVKQWPTDDSLKLPPFYFLEVNVDNYIHTLDYGSIFIFLKVF